MLQRMRVCSFFCAYEMKERTYGRLSGVTTRPEGPERGHFKGVFTQMHRNNAQGLLRANISLLLEKLHAWGHDCPPPPLFIRNP